MQLTVYNVASTLAGIRSHAIEQHTQEPLVQSTGEVPYVQIPQEPYVQSTEECLGPIPSCMHSDTFSLISASMILNSFFPKESPIYLTTEILSQPSLFSSKLSDLNFSYDTERKPLVKRDSLERQSPILVKGEIVMRKEILSLSEHDLTLKSHDHVCVSSDEITLKQHRDL